MVAPLVENKSAPISSVTEVILPIATKNVAGAQINPATEDGNLASILAKLDVALSTRALEAGGNLASILAKFVPLTKAWGHNDALTLNTDWFLADISPTNTPCLFRTMVMLATSGVFSAILINATVHKTLKLNGAVALVANAAYIFDILVKDGDTVNFQTSASGQGTIRVLEIVAGVQ
jgi:hypothetical protein